LVYGKKSEKYYESVLGITRTSRQSGASSSAVQFLFTLKIDIVFQATLI
jgi:hypothetical protein